jgi:glycosyltransferase involved in cell wall biosynthesis
MERRDLTRFDRVYVGSELDRRRLLALHGHGNVTVLPNAVRIPEAARRTDPCGPFTFLFLGNLGYYPNEDAVVFFCSEVLPRLRVLAARGFRLVVAGPLASRRVRGLSALAGVTVTGPVDDVADAYAGADAVVVPLRAGGGTRIKLLEAFAYRRPAVSTTIGAEGIEAQDGTHLLVADEAHAFAERCARLMAQPDLRAELAERASHFVRAHHNPERVRQILRDDHARG